MCVARQLLRTARLLPDELTAAVKQTRHAEVMHHLAQRFYYHAEHYYPPQVLQAVEAFSRAGYSDRFVEQAFVGRLDDLMQNCSPKRMVQVLRAATLLKVSPVEIWWPVVEPVCELHVKNIVEGIPTTVDALASLPCDTHELIDAYCFQLQCVPTSTAVFSKSLERLARHYDAERRRKLDTYKDRAYLLLKEDTLHGRDRLNLVAACQRLDWDLPQTTADVDIDELPWQARLRVRTPLAATKNRVEEKLRDAKYVIVSLPDELLDLAQLGECDFVRQILLSTQLTGSIKKYSPSQVVQIVRAANLVHDFSTTLVREALEILDRVYPQLDLAQRIWVHEAAVLCDHPLQKEDVHVSERLFGNFVAVGSVGVVSDNGGTSTTHGWRPRMTEDSFCDGEATPSRILREKYLQKRGWNVEHR
eukprot:GEMP01064145.1.p1 GENE.GEMP01064145.1~~GEMP01064145.1.p1  ORF type:complete len:425 (+),score=109.39 GEMP01064145.1:22-1275(+)